LILETIEKEKLLSEYPNASKFIKKLVGAHEFIQ
jgi:hypothetical protein